MTAFFMLSGFSIYYANIAVKEYRDVLSVVNFYKKRVVSIMPLYWFVAMVYPIYDIFVKGGRLKTNFFLAPIEFLGLQSVFHSIFELTHNGGTWFVSCILICYLGFPYYFELIKGMKLGKRRVITGITLALVRIYSSFLVMYLDVESTYANPFFRTLEFIIGMLLCAVWIDIRNRPYYQTWCARWFQVLLSWVCMIYLITTLVNHSIFLPRYMVYSGMCLPIFSWLIICSAGLKAEWIEKNRMFRYVVELGYAFFLADFAVKPLTNIFISYIGSENVVLIVLTFLICSVVAVIMHEGIEKPLKKLFQNVLKC